MRQYSRYANTIVIKNGDRYRNGIREKLNISPKRDDIFHTVKQGERIDNLAYNYYGQSNLWWVIADYNDLAFPLALETGVVLRLPSYEHLFDDLLEG